jgi:hypothetical protein
MCSYGGYCGIFNVHVSVIVWKEAYGPQVKDACALKEETIGENKYWNMFSRASEIMKPACHR